MNRHPSAQLAENQEVALSDLFALLEQQLELTEHALREQNVDTLPTHSEELARAIQQFQSAYQQSGQHNAATWAPRFGVVKARLDNLQKQWQTRSATVNRALGTLFPAEQAHAYARLGGKSGMGGLPRVSNKTSFKA